MVHGRSLKKWSTVFLDDLAEETYEFKVVTYTDHRRDDYVRYFNDYKAALEYWKSQIMRNAYAEHTASAAIIRVSTGEPIHRQTWRV